MNTPTNVGTKERSKLLEQALMRHVYDRSQFMMPRFTPGDWWECDLWAISRFDYSIEYEIKVTRADFRRDAKKARDFRWESLNKLGMIAAKDERCQNRFYYVTPRGLIAPAELPANCGLIAFGEYPEHARGHCFSDYGKVEVLAPLLHKRKPDGARVKQAMESAYHRFIRLEMGA